MRSFPYVYEKTKAMHIGRNISKIRELLGIKQQTLADALKISQQTLSKIEQTERLRDQTIERIAAAMNISVRAILNYDEKILILYLNNPECLDKPSEQPDYPSLFKKIEELYERLLQSEYEKRIAEK